MNAIINYKITLLFLLAVFTLNLEANPTFARQYNLSCSACHSQLPALNDMGLSFLRNGFRMSKYDTTALQGLLDSNSSARHYPIGAMVGLADNSNGDEVKQLVKLYLSGTITDSLSLMSSTKEAFSSDKSDQKLFQSGNSQSYFQYNFLEAKHVFRVGLLSRLTQLGNIQRSMANSGLNAAGGHEKNYFSPLQHADIKKIKGAEYSYLHDNNLLFLFSYGETIEKQDKSNHAFLGGIRYATASNYKIGLVYNYIDEKDDDYYSLILPVEKEYDIFTWNTSLVYANDSGGDYLGLENAFTFPLRDMEHVRAIINADRDENDNSNFGYSLGYNRIYKMFSFSVVASHIDTDTHNDNKLMGFIYLIF